MANFNILVSGDEMNELQIRIFRDQVSVQFVCKSHHRFPCSFEQDIVV